MTSARRDVQADAPWIIKRTPTGLFWRANRSGYTDSINEAGHYSEAEAKKIAQYGGSTAHPLSEFAASALSPPGGRPPEEAVGAHPETADVHCFGRVDGMGELHPEGSYVSLVTVSKSGERRVHRASIGAAENLIAELQAALPSPQGEPATVRGLREEKIERAAEAMFDGEHAFQSTAPDAVRWTWEKLDEITKGYWRTLASRAIKALSHPIPETDAAGGAVAPEGWQLVPDANNVTNDMALAWMDATDSSFQRRYRAMLDAAPHYRRPA